MIHNQLKDGLVQVVIPYELSLYEKGSTLTVPDELKKINVDSNPIFSSVPPTGRIERT